MGRLIPAGLVLVAFLAIASLGLSLGTEMIYQRDPWPCVNGLSELMSEVCRPMLDGSVMILLSFLAAVLGLALALYLIFSEVKSD